MARCNRVIYSGGFYELIFKARNSLPLPTLKLIEVIILGALARTQRDNKVTICHHIWMGNHVHMGVVAKDALALANFLQELQKKLTEALKRLLGMEHLNVWQGSAIVALIADPKKAAEKIAYWYANPAKANLVHSIDDYPGLSTWRFFRGALRSSNQILKSLNTCCSRKIPRIKLSMIPTVGSAPLDPRDDRRLARGLINVGCRGNEFHELNLYPNAWMAVFGISEQPEIERWNNEILHLTRQKEAEARQDRDTKKQRVIGVKNLIREPILKRLKSKPKSAKERRTIVISSDPKLRAKFIREIKSILSTAARLYKAWILGAQVRWPPGAFRPPLGPSANRIYQNSEPLEWVVASSCYFYN